jgi:hypothetical protein
MDSHPYMVNEKIAPTAIEIPPRSTVVKLAIASLVFGVIGLIALLGCALIGPVERAYRTELGLDRAANALTGGSDKETISSRGGRGEAEGLRRWCVICWIINRAFRDRDHCKKAIGT